MVDIKKCQRKAGKLLDPAEVVSQWLSDTSGAFLKARRRTDREEGGSPGFARMNDEERRWFQNNKLLPNAVKRRRRQRGRRAGCVKRDFCVILVNMRSFSEWHQKVLWTLERTEIWMVTGRVITQQDRPHAHKSHQTHYCLLLLLLFCPCVSL